MFDTSDRVLRTLLLALCLLSPAWLAAQEPAVTPPVEPERPSVEAVEARLKQSREATDLDEATVKPKVVEAYVQALDELRRAEQLKLQAAQHQQQAETVATRLEERKASLAETEAKLSTLKAHGPRPVGVQSVTELEQEAARVAAELQKATETLTQWKAESARRPTRREEILALLAAAPKRLEELQSQFEAPPPAGEQPALTAARQTLLTARLEVLQHEIPALGAELKLYEAERSAGLVTLKTDLWTRQVDLLQHETALLQEQIREQRRREDVERLKQAQREKRAALRKHPLLRPIAERNEELARKTQSLTRGIEQAEQQLNQSRQALTELEDEYARTREKVEKVGMNDAVGLLLRKQRAELPDPSLYGRQSEQREETMADVEFMRLELEERRDQLASPDAQIDALLGGAGDLTGEERIELRDAARELFDKQRQYLTDLLKSYDTYFEALSELDGAERRLLQLLGEYAEFIDQRVLWIRSDRPLSPTAMLIAGRQLTGFLDPAAWSDVLDALWDDVLASPVPFVTAALLFGLLLYARRRFRIELKEIGRQVQKGAFCRFAPTFKAVVLTALVTLLWPGLLFYFGWRLESLEEPTSWIHAVAVGLWQTAMICLPLELLRHICRTDGVATAHFEWPPDAVRRVRRNVRLLMSGLPLVFLMAASRLADVDRGRSPLERLCFLGLMLLLAVVAHRVLQPSTGVFREIIARDQSRWVERLGYVGWVVGVIMPLTLAVLDVIGYCYTARALTTQMLRCAGLVTALVLVRGLILRWVLMHRRRLAMDQARERRAAMQAAAPAEGEPGAPRPPEPETADLATSTTQFRRLLNMAVWVIALIAGWWIWADVLPALGFLDDENWTLWSVRVETNELVTQPDGSSTPVTLHRVEPVTVAKLALAVLVVVLTFVAAGNLPGLIELLLLKRLPLDAGLRYAISSLARYSLVLVGLFLACYTVRISWSNVQWLAAALTFGLGFGLQEIFANFVSGLIILFERPVRVGDIVTIDGVSGVVTRIRIRATTITDWDRKEFIVPNKEFITGRLLNWTLSDQMNRIVINVGVAYGSDVEKARELLLQAAQEQPAILADPAPMASFEGFGDSALNLVLRAFLPTMEMRLQVIHELHSRVHVLFREAGIEIPFPQQDLHVRSLDESLRPLMRRRRKPAAVAANGNGKD